MQIRKTKDESQRQRQAKTTPQPDVQAIEELVIGVLLAICCLVFRDPFAEELTRKFCHASALMA